MLKLAGDELIYVCEEIGRELLILMAILIHDCDTKYTDRFIVDKPAKKEVSCAE